MSSTFDFMAITNDPLQLVIWNLVQQWMKHFKNLDFPAFNPLQAKHLFTYLYLFTFYLTTMSVFQIIGLSVCLSVSMSVCLSIYLSMALQPFVGPWQLFQFLHLFTQSVGLLGRRSARCKAATSTQDNTNRIKAHRHPCLKWDSNPRSQCLSRRRQFMP
jgi:hypothetical protein